MNKMMKVLMLSCEKATELIDKKSLFDLSLKESVQLRMHTSMCSACSMYVKQSKLLDAYLKNYFYGRNENNVPDIDNIDLKEKILSKI